MRAPSAYEMYLLKLRDYIEDNNNLPMDNYYAQRNYYCKLRDIPEMLRKYVRSTAFPKQFMEDMEEFVSGMNKDNIPVELYESSTKSALKSIYTELMQNKESYFIDEWTLSKKGRSRLRNLIDTIPSALNIKPPEDHNT